MQSHHINIAQRILPTEFTPAAGEAMLRHLANPEGMPREVYDGLLQLLEEMDMAVARGHDAELHFDGMHAEAERLAEASPFTFHPDHGVLRKDEAAGIGATGAEANAAMSSGSEQRARFEVRTTAHSGQIVSARRFRNPIEAMTAFVERGDPNAMSKTLAPGAHVALLDDRGELDAGCVYEGKGVSMTTCKRDAGQALYDAVREMVRPAMIQAERRSETGELLGRTAIPAAPPCDDSPSP